MTVLGINPQKPLPARVLVAVPFFALHNDHFILAYKSGGEKDQVRRRRVKGTSQGHASALGESYSCLPGRPGDAQGGGRR